MFWTVLKVVIMVKRCHRRLCEDVSRIATFSPAGPRRRLLIPKQTDLGWSRLFQVFGSGINGCHSNTWKNREPRSEVLVRTGGISMMRFWHAYQRSEVAAVIMSLVVGHNFVLEVLNLLRVSALINNEDVLRSHSNSPFN